MANVDEPFAPLRAVAAAPMWFRLGSLVIGWLMIAAPGMAMRANRTRKGKSAGALR